MRKANCVYYRTEPTAEIVERETLFFLGDPDEKGDWPLSLIVDDEGMSCKYGAVECITDLLDFITIMGIGEIVDRRERTMTWPIEQ
jgi:hypothetical protein